MPLKVTTKGNKTTLVASGPMTIQNASELRKGLLDSLKGAGKSIVLDLSGVTESDIACIQVLCAAHKSVMDKDQAIKMVGQSAEIEEALASSGILQFAGCSSKDRESCLWLASRSVGDRDLS